MKNKTISKLAALRCWLSRLVRTYEANVWIRRAEKWAVIAKSPTESELQRTVAVIEEYEAREIAKKILSANK